MHEADLMFTSSMPCSCSIDTFSMCLHFNNVIQHSILFHAHRYIKMQPISPSIQTFASEKCNSGRQCQQCTHTKVVWPALMPTSIKMDGKKIAKKRLENYITKASWADYIFTFVASLAVGRWSSTAGDRTRHSAAWCPHKTVLTNRRVNISVLRPESTKNKQSIRFVQCLVRVNAITPVACRPAIDCCIKTLSTRMAELPNSKCIFRSNEWAEC